MPKISVGRDQEDREKYGLKGTGVIGKHLVGEKQEAHMANPVHMDVARPHVVGVFGKRGTGKCLKPGQKVFTEEHGLIEVEKLFERASSEGLKDLEKGEGEEFYKWNGPSTLSIDPKKKCSNNKIVGAYRKKIEEYLLKIETCSGRKITVTQDHPLLTASGWENADKLLKGDKIGIPREIRKEFQTQKLEIPEGFEQADYKSISVRKMNILESEGSKINRVHDGSGSFNQLIKKTESEDLIQIEDGAITVTEKGEELVEDNKTSDHYRFNKSRPVKLPKTVSPMLAEFLAYLIAEGHEQKIDENNYRLMFVNKNKELKKRFENLGETLFDLQFKEMDELTVYANSRALEKFLKHNGYKTGANSFNKEIPNFILQSPKQVVSTFLTTLFDCEANVTRQDIEFTSASKDITNKVSYMLMRFGIVSRISEKEKYASNTEEQTKRTYYHLAVSGSKNLEKFKEEIGFQIDYKQQKLEKISKRDSNTNVDTVPCKEVIRDARTSMGADRTQVADHKQSLKAYEDEKYQPSREKLGEITERLENHLSQIQSIKTEVETQPSMNNCEELIEKTDIKWKEINKELGYERTDRRFLEYKKYQRNPEKVASKVLKLFKGKHDIEKAENSIEQLKNLSSSDVFWDEIERIERENYEGYVYDLTVENDHNFLAGFGGITCHNSYSLGTIVEELQTVDVSKNLSTIVVDPMGVFWSMKRPNDRSAALLEKWGLDPEAFDAKIYIPKGKSGEYEEDGLPYDDTFTLNPGEFTAQEWGMAFGIDMGSERGIILERVVSKLQEKFGSSYQIDYIIRAIRKTDFSEEAVEGLVNRFKTAEKWGVFGEESSIDKFTSRGELSVIDSSAFGEMSSGWSVQSLIVALLGKRILRERMTARRLEEIDEMENISKNEMPIVWMLIDEAHEFLPAKGKTPATDPLLRWVKLGREPGVSLVLATQQPAKLHPDALSQCDLILSHRLTAEQDINALGEIMQTYMRYDLKHYIDALPDKPGTGLILDDNSERVYPVQMRPRKSWHAGGTPNAFNE